MSRRNFPKLILLYYKQGVTVKLIFFRLRLKTQYSVP